MSQVAEKHIEHRIPLSLIFPNPDQPRKHFDQNKLEELAASAKNHGIFTPILLTPRGDRYMIIAGERRWRASNLAGLHDIPARTIEADDELVEELALLENIQRDDLNIMEEAMAYQEMLNRGWTEEKLAEKLGFKQSWRIGERLSLLNLSSEHQALVVDGKIGKSQAFEISRLPPARQTTVFAKLQSGGLQTYNKLRAYVEALLGMEAQGGFFELQTLTAAERVSVDSLNSFMVAAEKFISVKYDREHLQKAVFHTPITVERMDMIIFSLQKIRKDVQTGDGIKAALSDEK